MMMRKITSCVMLMMMLMCVTEVSAQWSVTPEAGMNVTKYKDSPAAVGFKAGAAVSYTFGSGLFSLQSGLYYVQRGTGKGFYGAAYGKTMDKDGKEVDYFLNFAPGYLESFGYGNFTGYGGYGYYGNGGINFPLDMRVEGIRLNEGSVRRDYLQLPILARFNWKIGEDVRLHIAAGPYLAYGIGGKKQYSLMEISEKGFSTTSDSWNPFGKNSSYKRFDWGLTLNAGIEVKRFTFNATYYMGLGKESKYDDIGLKYHTVSFTIGYRF